VLKYLFFSTVHPTRRKKALAAVRRIKVIAGMIFPDLYRKLASDQHERY